VELSHPAEEIGARTGSGRRPGRGLRHDL